MYFMKNSFSFWNIRYFMKNSFSFWNIMYFMKNSFSFWNNMDFLKMSSVRGILWIFENVVSSLSITDFSKHGISSWNSTMLFRTCFSSLEIMLLSQLVGQQGTCHYATVLTYCTVLTYLLYLLYFTVLTYGLTSCPGVIPLQRIHILTESENLGTEDLGILSRQSRSGMLENQSTRLGASTLTRRRPEGSADFNTFLFKVFFSM